MLLVFFCPKIASKNGVIFKERLQHSPNFLTYIQNVYCFSIILQVKESAFGIHMFMNTQTSLQEVQTVMSLQIHIINTCRMWQP